MRRSIVFAALAAVGLIFMPAVSATEANGQIWSEKPPIGPSRRITSPCLIKGGLPQVTDSDFERRVLNSKKSVVVDIWRPQCMPCVKYSSVLARVSEDKAFKGRITFVGMNASLNPETSNRYEITGVPTTLLVSNQSVVAKTVGFMNEDRLSEWIRENLPEIDFSQSGPPAPPQPKLRIRAAFPFGMYRLNASVKGFVGLAEYSDAAYGYANRAGMGRLFENEKNYHAPAVTFLGQRWRVTLQTVYGKIYKIAPFLEFKKPGGDEADQLAMEMFRYCSQRLGEPSSQRTGIRHGRMPGLVCLSDFLWDTTDGTVELRWNSAEVSLFITAKTTPDLRPRIN